jgi:hypothetical protein
MFYVILSYFSYPEKFDEYETIIYVVFLIMFLKLSNYVKIT